MSPYRGRAGAVFGGASAASCWLLPTAVARFRGFGIAAGSCVTGAALQALRFHGFAVLCMGRMCLGPGAWSLGRASVAVSAVVAFWGRGAPPPHAAELESRAGLAPLLAVFTNI